MFYEIEKKWKRIFGNIIDYALKKHNMLYFAKINHCVNRVLQIHIFYSDRLVCICSLDKRSI